MDKYARFRYQPCIPLGDDGRCVTASKKHIELSRRAATEGMVLLKNENEALPLAEGTKIALFGKATIEYIKGGGGSGDVNTPYIRNIYEGFKTKDVSLYMPLVDFYTEYVEKESVNIPTQEQINATWDIVNAMEFCTNRDDMTYDTFASMHVKEPEVPQELIKSASEWADTAVITLSRFSAEGVDRRPIAGDYYLSDVEKNLIDSASELFDKVIIVINSGAVIDCEYFAENDGVSAVLFGWQAEWKADLLLPIFYAVTLILRVSWLIRLQSLMTAIRVRMIFGSASIILIIRMIYMSAIVILKRCHLNVCVILSASDCHIPSSYCRILLYLKMMIKLLLLSK